MIIQLNQNENKNTSGSTMDIHALRETLSRAAMKCANALSAYAASKQDGALMKKMGYSDSAVRKMRKAEFEALCKMIFDEATRLLEKAAAYGYTQEDVTALGNCLARYEASFAVDRNLFNSKIKTEELMQEFAMGRRRAA